MFKTENAANIVYDKELRKFFSATVEVNLRMSQVPDSVKGSVERAFQRGYMNAGSGTAYKLYCLLCQACDVPMFLMNRSDLLEMSFRTEDRDKMQGVADVCRAMWKLDKSRTYWPTPSTRPGHAHGWVTLRITRPASLTDDGLLNLLGVTSLFEIIPKENALRAISVLRNGHELRLSYVKGGD